MTGHALTIEVIADPIGLDNVPYSGRLIDKPSDGGDPLSSVNSIVSLRLNGCSVRTTTGGAYAYEYGDYHGGAYGTGAIHIAMTYDGTTLKYYINGCLYQSKPCTGDLLASSQPVNMAMPGVWPITGVQQEFKGHLDEVRIWSVVRSQDDLLANLKNLPNPSGQAGLLAYYKFEGNLLNVQGNSAYDATAVNPPSFESWTIPASIKPFAATSTVTQPSCGQSNGEIHVYASGGGSQYTTYVYSLNGGAFTPIGGFYDLAPGSYTIKIQASSPEYNACGTTLNFTLAWPCATSASATAGFTAPDTVCTGTPVSVTNAASGASTYAWNFCTTPNFVPQGTNLGNPGNFATQPTVVDYVNDNGNYYAFVLRSAYPAELIRLDYGNSMLNTPAVTDLGTMNGRLDGDIQGISFVKDNGNWYCFIVGVQSAGRIEKLEFGPSITNPSPTITNWGNVGFSLSYPHDLYMFKESGIWYGMTMNTTSNSYTTLRFGTDFSSPPTFYRGGTGTGMSGPAGFFPINDNGFWRVFVVNNLNNHLVRLDFGSSLLNSPTSVDLGNPGLRYVIPSDIVIFRDCSQTVGYVLNNNSNNIIKLDFTSLSAAPTTSDLGNLGNLNAPNAFSHLFRGGSDLYALVPNTSSNTLTRLKLTGSGSCSVPLSTLPDPAPVVYATPGSYTITQALDDALPTQVTACKKIVVVDKPSVTTPLPDVDLCPGNSTVLNAQIANATTYSWSPATGLSSATVANPTASPSVTTQYVVTGSGRFCSTTDTVMVRVLTPQQCSQSTTTAAFSAPDTVCVNDNVPITNSSVNASSYYWNFCVADVNAVPTAVNLGNPGNKLSQPVFSDMAQFNGNYYSFVINHVPGGVVRLDYGNSPLNTPAATLLGNISGVMNANYGNEGIQIVKSNGNWYGLTVGGAASSVTIPKLVIISFGPNLDNPAPTAVAYNNIGGMQQPIDLHVFQENGNWYGFTVSAENNTITRFSFGPDFTGTPTAVNLGNIGSLNYPTGVFAANDNGFWRIFVTNQNTNSITRLDFGSSLLNTPTGVNLGNPGNVLAFPRDITILQYCGQSVGFVVNGSTNTIARLNFSSLSATPTGTNLGNLGTLNFPHSLSKLFRVGNDIYSFITNVNNNTITRVKFSGCTSSSLPSSTAQAPTGISYNAPGTYNINLTVDDGLPTQTAFCKKVVVLARPAVTTAIPDATICPGGATILTAQIANATTYSWSPATGLSSTTVPNPTATPAVTTQYVVTASNGFCTITDTVIVKVLTPQQCNQVTVTPGFTAPDTVCVNAPVTIANTSVNASSYYWSFCLANLNNPPTGTDLGNIGNQFSIPVFMDYVQYNGNYYGFLINYNPGSLIRLDFGNSLLNTPTATNLGNFGGIIPPGLGAEGVQIVNNEDRWYAIIVGGYTPSGSTPRILKVDFGPNLTNPTPVATNWGNIGTMSQPIDLHVFREGANWYGFTVNAENNTITRFNFTSSFNNTPTAVNLGNIGNLTYPTGIYAINDNGFWRVFIVNAGNGDRTSGTFSLTRLDFGSSLLNTPTGVNLGNPGGMLQHPRDLTIMKLCDQIIGFAVDGHPSYNSVVKMDFHNNLASTPTITSLGNIGNLNFPHSISKLFRVGNDVYAFITNAYGNNLSRLKFTGCTASSIPSSTAQTPPAVSYNTPGTYTISLTVDEGLPSQSAVCRQVVVMPALPHQPTQQYTICPGGSIKIGAATHPGTYAWNTGATTDSIIVNTAGTYWVQTSRTGCSVIDSFVVSVTPKPDVDFGFVQNTCQPKSVQFTSNLTGTNSYQWNFGDLQTNTTTQTPVHVYANYGAYRVALKYQYGSCSDSVVRTLNFDNVYDASLIGNIDTTICLGDSVLVRSNAVTLDPCYQVTGDPQTFAINGYVKPTSDAVYHVTTQVLGPNLVPNGDFSGGNTGFTSDYTYAFPNTTEGQYWVGAALSSWNGNMSNCGDHTSGTGNMMAINGSPAANKKIWMVTVPVTPNTTYDFSGWITSLHSTNPAQLQFSINNINLGNSITATAATCQWNRFSSAWNSGSSTSATIAIVNNNTIAAGNDFALDDLYFGTMTMRNDSFAVSVTGLCDSIKLSGGDKVCSPTDTLTYNVYRSARCTQPLRISVDPVLATVVSQTANSFRVVFRQNGITTVKVSFDNACKRVVDSIKVTVKFSPASIRLGPDVTTCSDTTFTLHAGVGFGTYQWQDGSTDSVYQVHTAGTYQVQATNICGARYADTLVFTRSFPRPFTVSPLTGIACVGDSVVFRAGGGSSYSWSPASYFSYPDSSVTKAAINFTGNFILHISDTVCVRDTVVTIPVTASRLDGLSVFKSNDVNCSNDSARLSASGATTYAWSPNLYVTHTAAGTITVKPPVTTTYYILAANQLGCTRKDSVTVYFTKDGDQKLYVPTAFTPNGDGLNDVFKPIFTGPATKYDFKVFNRWGQLVYHSTTPNAGWDGTFRSVLQPGDAYVYYVTAEGGCNGQFVQKGTFVLIR